MVHFNKYHGAGNDFILIDDRSQSKPLTEFDIRSICDRHLGIGADGLILLEPHPELDFRMVYYNSDGLEGSMCGNGGRCAAAFAFHLTGRIHLQFEAYDGIHEAWIIDSSKEDESQVRISLMPVKNWQVLTETECYLDTGSPHHVRFEDDVRSMDILANGRAIRHHERYAPNGVNANFAVVQNDTIFCRTYERGVEDETLSCGTGVAATALAASLLYGLGSPIEIQTSGGILQVSFERRESIFENIFLTGPTVKVFEGQINI